MQKKRKHIAGIISSDNRKVEYGLYKELLVQSKLRKPIFEIHQMMYRIHLNNRHNLILIRHIYLANGSGRMKTHLCCSRQALFNFVKNQENQVLFNFSRMFE